MTQSNAFVLKNSGLGPFLYAEVGTELNGSELTMLSVLARLDEDPWAVAARFARLPRAAIIDQLVSRITQMPLRPQALENARATASRLSLLLPAQTVVQGADASQEAMPAMRGWLPLAMVLVALAFGLSVNYLAPQPAAKTPVAGQVSSVPLKPVPGSLGKN